MFQASPVFVIRPASPNSWTANATRPADTKMSTTPVIVKKRRRSMRTPAAKIAYPIPTADGESGEGREEGRHGGPARRPDGEEEEDRLEALARDGDEREARERRRRPGGEREIDPVLELALHGPALATHPEEHPGEDDDREDRSKALDALLDDERQTTDGRDHQPTDDDREHQGRRDADPHAAHGVAAIEPDEVRGDDAHDERRLEALAKRDEERGGHGIADLGWTSGRTGPSRKAT